MSSTSAPLRDSLPLGLAALVFLPAGRIDWAAGWIFIAVLVAAFGHGLHIALVVAAAILLAGALIAAVTVKNEPFAEPLR
jgi:hypothetical protein